MSRDPGNSMRDMEEGRMTQPEVEGSAWSPTHAAVLTDEAREYGGARTEGGWGKVGIGNLEEGPSPKSPQALL